MKIFTKSTKKSTAKIIKNSLVKVNDNKMTIISTDTDNWHYQTYETNLVNDTFFVSNELLKKLKSINDIELLKSNDYQENDFPVYPELGEKLGQEILTTKLLKDIKSFSFSMADKDVRFYLNGAMLNNEGIVMSDGHRLTKINHEFNIDKPIIILNDVIKTLSKQKSVKMEIYSDYVKFTWDNHVLISKLIDARYPDFGRIFYKEKVKQNFKNCDVQNIIEKTLMLKTKSQFNTLVLTEDKSYIMENVKVTFNALDVDLKGNVIGFSVDYLNDLKPFSNNAEFCFLVNNNGFFDSLHVKENNIEHVLMCARV